MILYGDCREKLAEIKNGTANTCVTSPPYYGLRDYGVNGQIGLEQSPEEYVQQMVEVFREVKRVLADDGTLWLNLGDSFYPHGGSRGNKTPAGDTLKGRDNLYQPAPKLKNSLGIKGKDLIGIPWMVAFALRADGWYLRSDIIWSKPNCMPESVTDRPTKAHEYLFLLSKHERYYYDHEAIKEPVVQSTVLRLAQNIENQQGSERANGGDKTNGNMKAVGDGSERNKRSVWTVPTANFSEAHFATFPEKLIEPCILAGCPIGGIVLDPFFGAGTTGLVAIQNDRNYIGIELNPEYIEIAKRRLEFVQPVMNF